MLWMNGLVEKSYKKMCSVPPKQWNIIDPTLLPSYCIKPREKEKMFFFSIKQRRFLLQCNSEWTKNESGKTTIDWSFIALQNKKIHPIGYIRTPEIPSTSHLIDHFSALFQSDHANIVHKYTLALKGLAILQEPDCDIV